MDNQENEKINCYNCIHFVVTWNPTHPRGCKLFGFKSVELPCVTVLKSSGSPCVGFERKGKT